MAPVVAAWLVPVAAFVVYVPWAARADRESTSVVGPPTAAVTVGSRSLTLRQAVDVVVESAPAATVFAPAGGMLTAVGVAPGEQIATGTALGAIDGARVFASVGRAPIHRDVGLGQAGADVEAVAALLVSLGHLSATDAGSSVTPAMVTGIKGFQRAIGAAADGVFRARHAVYVPTGGTVGRYVPQIGGQVALGSPLIELRLPLTALTFRPAGAGSSLARFVDVPLTLRAGSAAIEVSSLSPDADEIAKLYGFLLKSAPTSGDEPANQGTRPTTRFTGLMLSWRNPKTVATVPAPAVLTRDADRHCLLEVHADGIVPVRLTQPAPLPGELGVVAVAAELAGRTVLADASRAPEEAKRACG